MRSLPFAIVLALLAAVTTSTDMFPGDPDLTELSPFHMPPADDRGPVPFWQELGPYGTTVNTLTYHPTAASLVYLGSFEDGLYYSLNEGLEWKNLYPGGSPISFVKIDPLNPSIVLVGAGNWFSEPGYLRRSTDWGQTWSSMFEGKTLTDAAFDPRQSGVVYMTTGTDSDWAPAEFYRSTDSGESWVLMNPGGTYESGTYIWGFFDLIVSPEDGRILASTIFTPGGEWTENHVCLSTNGGADWDYMDTGLHNNHAWDMEYLVPGVIGAATEDGIYIHREGGMRWIGISNELEGSNCFELAPGPTENIWYAVKTDNGDYGDPDSLYRSDSHGLSWTPLSQIEDPCEIITVAANTNDSPGEETILAGTWEAGIFASENLGQSWEERNFGLPPLTSTAIAYGPSGSGLCFTGTDGILHAGFYKSYDLGETWELANNGLPGGTITAISPHPTDDQVIVAANRALGIYRTLDQGRSWTRLENGLPDYGYTNCLMRNHSEPQILFAGTEYGLFRSTDGGDSWVLSDEGIEHSNVRDISCDPLDPLHMFAASYGDGMYESLDGGVNWENILDDGDWNDYVSVAVAPGGDLVFAGMLTTQKLYRTTDGGDDWKIVLNQSVKTILIPADLPGTVACGGSHPTIRVSLNNGDDWFTLPGLLQATDVSQLRRPPENGGILSAATSSGVLRLTPR